MLDGISVAGAKETLVLLDFRGTIRQVITGEVGVGDVQVDFVGRMGGARSNNVSLDF